MKRATVLALVGAVILSAPTLGVGIVLDDYLMVARAKGDILTGRPFDFFTFAHTSEFLKPLIENGPYPWWTLPNLKLSFMRPLASASFQLDYELFGERYWAYHLHSILLLLLLILAAGQVFKKVLPAGAAGLALVLYAFDDSHALPTTWLANRNALLAAIPAVLALSCWVRWREEAWAPGRWLAPLLLALAFLSGESTLGTVGYFAAYELLKPGPLKQKVTASLPVLSVLVLWVLVYRGFGFGSWGSATYIDPGASPLEFIINAPTRISALTGSLLLGVTSDLWLIAPRVRPVLIASGLVGIVLLTVVLRKIWPSLEQKERQALQWLTLGAVFSLVPVASTFPTDRLLLPASLGGAGVFGILLHRLWQDRAGWSAKVTIGWLGWVGFVVPVAAWLANPVVIGKWTKLGSAAVLEAPILPTDDTVVLVTTPDPAPAMYGTLFMKAAGRTPPPRWWTLTMDPNAHLVKRVGPHSLEVESVGGYFFESVFEQLVRDEHNTLKPGDTVQLAGARITIVDTQEPRVRKIRADFDKPLDAMTLLIWRNRHYEKLPPMADGETLEVSRQPTLMESAM